MVSTHVRLEVFDQADRLPAMADGIGLPREVVCFLVSLAWLRMNGVSVNRHNPDEDFNAFLSRSVVEQLTQRVGLRCLPLILRDDRVVSCCRYPTRLELAMMAGLYTPWDDSMGRPVQNQGLGCCSQSWIQAPPNRRTRSNPNLDGEEMS